MADAIRGSYRILIVSSSDKFNSFAGRILTGERYERIDITKSASAAQRKLLEQNYDIVVINVPLPDTQGVDLARDLSTRYSAGILLVLPNEIYDDITEQVIDEGIVTITKPVSSIALSRGVRLLCAMKDKFRGVEKKARTMEEKMEEIRIINRAKWLLIENRMISENEAHALIGKQAMNRCVPKRTVAEAIIREYEGGDS